MSIANNKSQYEAALKKAHQKYPPKTSYPKKPSECNHDFSFIVYCDGNDLDIARCPYCGTETVVRCTFDDDYD